MTVSTYPTGTTVYNPEKCENGYTVFGATGSMLLIDMNGNTVNLWQGLGGNLNRMFPGGYITGSTDRAAGRFYYDWNDFIEVDWDGNIVWEFSKYELIDEPGKGPVWTLRGHHDFEREGSPVGYWTPGMDPLSTSGNTFILYHKDVTKPTISDKPLLDCSIIEVTWDGKIIWEWLCSDHFDEIGFSEEAKHAIALNPNIITEGSGERVDPNLDEPDQIGDWVHLNSISLLGPNKWFDRGDERFHPDNIICAGRQTNHIAIIDKKTGKLVWQVGPDYTATEALRKLGQIIGQHHAHMIPRGLPGEGNILVFDNGGWAGYVCTDPSEFMGFRTVRRDYSRVLEFDPTTLEIMWQYTPDEAGLRSHINSYNFYSSIISGMQRLPNGNTLITEGTSGRIFEVTREHEIVWEYVSPYMREVAGRYQIPIVYRAYRVPYEWVPQVSKPKEKAITRIDNTKFIVPGSSRRRTEKVTKIRTRVSLSPEEEAAMRSRLKGLGYVKD